MSLVQKTDPKGIDFELAKIQTVVYNKLTALPAANGYGWTDYNSYERVYLNEKEGNIIPELYVGDSTATNKDYREIYYDDNHNAESYFVVDSPRPFDERFTATVGMIFQMDLPSIFPTIAHRADEEAHRHVLLSLQKAMKTTKISSLITGIDNVYSGLFTDQIKTTDMQPCHVFRFNFEVNYDYNC